MHLKSFYQSTLHATLTVHAQNQGLTFIIKTELNMTTRIIFFIQVTLQKITALNNYIGEAARGI